MAHLLPPSSDPWEEPFCDPHPEHLERFLWVPLLPRPQLPTQPATSCQNFCSRAPSSSWHLRTCAAGHRLVTHISLNT
jgi:hypothetical protein